MLNGLARRRGIAVATGALVVVLAACGSQPNSVTVKKAVSPQKAVLASVQATAAAKSARISMKVSTDATGADGFALTADGVSDFATGAGDLTMNFTGPAAKFLGGGIEVRTVDGVAYVQMPDSLGSMLGGGKWLKTPDLGTNKLVPGLDQSDPTQFLAYLETVSSGVTKVGTESIRGVETTHYEATLDLGKAVDKSHVPASLKDALGKLVQKDGSSFTIPADVWVGNDGLTRRIQLKLDLGKIAGAGSSAPAMTMTMDLYDFGVPVNVEAPPASDTIDMKDFGMNGGGTFGSLGTSTTLGAPA